MYIYVFISMALDKEQNAKNCRDDKLMICQKYKIQVLTSKYVCVHKRPRKADDATVKLRPDPLREMKNNLKEKINEWQTY